MPSGSATSETSSSWPPSWKVVTYLTSFCVMMSGPEPAARSAVTSVLYSAGSYSLSSIFTFGCSAVKASARVWNSGVVSMLHPDSVRVTGASGSALAPVSVLPEQPARARAATAAMLPAARILRFMWVLLLCNCGCPGWVGDADSGEPVFGGGRVGPGDGDIVAVEREGGGGCRGAIRQVHRRGDPLAGHHGVGDDGDCCRISERARVGAVLDGHHATGGERDDRAAASACRDPGAIFCSAVVDGIRGERPAADAQRGGRGIRLDALDAHQAHLPCSSHDRPAGHGARDLDVAGDSGAVSDLRCGGRDPVRRRERPRDRPAGLP